MESAGRRARHTAAPGRARARARAHPGRRRLDIDRRAAPAARARGAALLLGRPRRAGDAAAETPHAAGLLAESANANEPPRSPPLLAPAPAAPSSGSSRRSTTRPTTTLAATPRASTRARSSAEARRATARRRRRRARRPPNAPRQPQRQLRRALSPAAGSRAGRARSSEHAADPPHENVPVVVRRARARARRRSPSNVAAACRRIDARTARSGGAADEEHGASICAARSTERHQSPTASLRHVRSGSAAA